MMGSMPSIPALSLEADSTPAAATSGGRAARLRWEVFGFAIVVLGLLLRVFILSDRSLVWDETFSIFIASQPTARIITLTAVNDAHPPLYYLLLHWWVYVFGTSAGAVRALSVPIGAAVVALTWMFGRRLVGDAAALLAAALVALAPSQVSMGQEARMYGLLALTTVGSWWALWAGVNGGRRVPWVVYTVVVAAMAYTHYYGIFVVMSHAAYLAWQRAPVAIWRRWVYAGLVVFILLWPWLPLVPTQLATERAWPVFRPRLTAGAYVDTLTSITVGQLFVDAFHPGNMPRELSWTMSIGAAAVIGVGYRALRHAKDARPLLIASVFGPLTLAFGISLLVNFFAPRYLTFLMPGLALLGGAGVAALASRKTRWARAAAALAMVVLLVPNVVALVQYYQYPKLDFFDWRQVSRTLAAQAHDDDAIVFLPGFARIAVNYYYPALASQPRLVLTPYGQDVLGPKNERLPEVVAFLAPYPRVWIISVIPVPPSVDAMMAALGRQSFAVTRREEVNVMRLFLLERKAAP